MSGEEDFSQGHCSVYMSHRSNSAATPTSSGPNDNLLSSESIQQRGQVREGEVTGGALREDHDQSLAYVNPDGPAHGRHIPRASLGLSEVNEQRTLPEDDGMSELRRKIHAIRDLDISSTERAQMIHTVMTESYYTAQGGEGGRSKSMEMLPSGTASQCHFEVSETDNEQAPTLPSTDKAPIASFGQLSNPYNLTREDLAPAYCPKVEMDRTVCDGENLDAEEFEEACLGCEHYKRNVKMQCFTCKKWYTCRFCHDEVENHHLIRQKTENMLCMLCGHAQRAAQYCEGCGEQAARYYCSICKLWDDDGKKNIYHCNDCGICRIGKGLGKDFFHCKTCSVCLPISIANTHRCIERSTQCDCPICGDYMFTSPETVVVMRCGHSIHRKCLSEYSKSSYRCPICSKTVTNMEYTFRNLDRAIESQPMPSEFKDTKALVHCSDCGAKSIVQYHWLGLRCDLCESYNSAQIRLLQGGVLESSEDDSGARNIPTSRLRPLSYDADRGSLSSALASLQVNTSSAPGSGPHPQLGTSLLARPNGQFTSYSLTRDRVVSPVVSNYFGLPPDRESNKLESSSLPGDSALRGEPNERRGELHILGRKFKYRYGPLDEDSQLVAEASQVDDESLYDTSDGVEEESDGDDDDDYDSIDIFGHR